MSDIIWTTCSKCNSQAERGFSRDYCTNTECEFFDLETYTRAHTAKPVPTIFASRSDGPPTWDEITPVIWPCVQPIDPPSKLCRMRFRVGDKVVDGFGESAVILEVYDVGYAFKYDDYPGTIKCGRAEAEEDFILHESPQESPRDVIFEIEELPDCDGKAFDVWANPENIWLKSWDVVYTIERLIKRAEG